MEALAEEIMDNMTDIVLHHMYGFNQIDIDVCGNWIGTAADGELGKMIQKLCDERYIIIQDERD